MRKPWFLGLLAILLLVFAGFVSAAHLNMDVTLTNPPAGNPGTSVNGSLVIEASGDNLTGVTYSTAQLVGVTDSTKTIAVSQVTFNPQSGINVNDGQEVTVTVSVSIPNYLMTQSYQGTVTVTEGGDSETALLTVTVNSLTAFDVESFDLDTSLVVSGQPDDERERTFSVKNTGNQPLTSLTFSYDTTKFKDGDGDTITLTFTPQTFTPAITPSNIGTVTVKAEISEDVDYGVYTAPVTVSGSGSDTFELEIRVQPEVCEEGTVGKLSITDLDTDSSKYAPGETIKIDVDVKNKDDDDMDVVVQALLYDIDDDENIAEYESEVLEIEKGKTETFELEIEIPTNVDTANTFILYVKAYEDGEEEDNCYEDYQEIKIERDKHSTVVKKITITPATAKKGESVTINVEVENIGTKDEDEVTVKVLNAELGLDLVTEEFELDKYDKDNADAVKRFTFVVPEDATAQEYDIEAIVTYNDGKDTKSGFGKLTVLEEEKIVGAIKLSTEGVVTTIEKDGAFSIPVAVTNEFDAVKEVTLSLTNLYWADPVTDIVLTLQPAQTTTVYFYVNPKADLAVGKHTVTVSVKMDKETVASETLTFDVQEAEKEVVVPTGSTVMDVFKGNTIWIIGDVVLLIIALFLIKMLFKKQH